MTTCGVGSFGSNCNLQIAISSTQHVWKMISMTNRHIKNLKYRNTDL